MIDIPGAGSLSDIAAQALAASAKSAQKAPCTSCRFAKAAQDNAEAKLKTAMEEIEQWRERDEERERLNSTATGATLAARQKQTIKMLQKVDETQRKNLDAAEERVVQLMMFIVDAGLKVPPYGRRGEDDE